MSSESIDSNSAWIERMRDKYRMSLGISQMESLFHHVLRGADASQLRQISPEDYFENWLLSNPENGS